MKDPNILKAEILAKQKELAELEKEIANDKYKLVIRELSEISSEEKIRVFNNFYKIVIDSLEKKRKNPYSGEDEEHYVWEGVMEIVARDKAAFWVYYNSLMFN